MEENTSLSFEENLKNKHFLDILKTQEDLKNWVYTYLDIVLPFGHIADGSNGSPGEAIWEAYRVYRDDLYEENPGYIWLANRDGAKTLSGSILNILLLLHFKAEIAHFAAVKKQAEKCIEYTNIFMKKVNPYLEFHGRKVVSDTKTKIQIRNADNSVSFIDVIVATLAGGNSQRSNFASFDELDTLSPVGLAGYREAKLIPTRKFGHGPLTVKYSTRKFSFGIFEKEIQEIGKSGEKLLSWNILDITEKCQDFRSLKPNGKNHLRYVKKKLPFRLYVEEEYQAATASEKHDFKQIQLYDGCLTCPLASVCHGNLADRPETDVYNSKGLLKSIPFTIGQFRKTSTDMAEAQILNWKASSKGLLYPKFEDINIISIDKAWEMITGNEVKNVQLDDLIALMKQSETQFNGGVDWGHTHNAALTVLGVLPTGYSIFVDMLAVPGLETHEFCEAAIPYQEKYGVRNWYCDNSQPAAIKTFKRIVGAKCPDFVKDVEAGIDAIRSQIVTTTGYRKLYVLDIPQNEFLIDMFRSHHFILDAVGNPTKKRADDEWADVGDTVRYLGQNLFQVKGNKPGIAVSTSTSHLEAVHKPNIDAMKQKNEVEEIKKAIQEANEGLMKNKVSELTGGTDSGPSVKKKGGLFWAI